MSPTSHSVVQETLRRAQTLKRECKKQAIVITYDLAIAKIAFQIQAEEKPAFDDVFIALGAFHIEMAFLSALGTYVAESGGLHVLNESLVLAKGSTNTFQKGKKNCKRCKDMNEILALSMEHLHFESFLDTLGDERNDELIRLKQDIGKLKESGAPLSRESIELLEKYKSYAQDTSQSVHGQTPQYWQNYIDMNHTYHDFSRSIREGDFELYKHCLVKMTNMFFAMNQPNYARWTVKFHDNLLKLEESHPEIYFEFKEKLFGIQRSGNSFSRSPIDLTLEQTINRDAAYQRTGISAITNNISARQRWAESHFLRTEIIGDVFRNTGLDKKDDVSSHLRKGRIAKDNSNLTKLISTLKDTMNPFDKDLDQSIL